MHERKRIGVDDIMREFLLDGVVGVQRLLDGRDVSKFTVQKALRTLRDRGVDIDEINRWTRKHLQCGVGGAPGRKPPVVGEQRFTQIQETKRGALHVKTPLATFTGAKKGGRVKHTFYENRIIIEPA